MQYPYIHAWHLLTGANRSYVSTLVDRASKDNAPDDAIYYSVEGKYWRTLRDLREGHPMIERMNAWIEQ